MDNRDLISVAPPPHSQYPASLYICDSASNEAEREEAMHMPPLSSLNNIRVIANTADAETDAVQNNGLKSQAIARGPRSRAEGKPKGRKKKMEIKFIEDRTKRQVAFSKRKSGIMKKAQILCEKTGCEMMVIMATKKKVFTYTTDLLAPFVETERGQEFIRKCLNTNNEEDPVIEPSPSSLP